MPGTRLTHAASLSLMMLSESFLPAVKQKNHANHNLRLIQLSH